ncbi:MAG: hypothetical protein Q9M09_05485 [Mariprofundaceae bacterium]|nr:hypothetical protein [Mariprofundaceae bacterium]
MLSGFDEAASHGFNACYVVAAYTIRGVDVRVTFDQNSVQRWL